VADLRDQSTVGGCRVAVTLVLLRGGCHHGLMTRRWGLAVLLAWGCGGMPSPAEGTESGTAMGEATGDSTTVTGTTNAATSTTASSSTLDDTSTPTSTTDDPTGDPPQAGPRYDEVRQKSSHNSYQRDEALVDQLVYHRVRSLELDLHVGKTLESTVAGDWFIYHTDLVDDATSCRLLSDCLGELRVFAQAVPEHEAITLWLDLKDDWADAHQPADLDAMLEQALGEALWGPADLLAACPGAPDLATSAIDPACGWPPLASLRGRVVVVLTGGDLSQPDTPLSIYAELGQRAFVAPSVTTAASLRTPDPRVVIYNANAQDTAAIAAAVTAGFVARAWDANDETLWAQAVRAGAHHVATDLVNLHRDPWTITHDADGWPFTCLDPCTPSGPEPGAIVGIAVDSGDIWAATDDFRFAHVDRTATPDGEWTTLVSAANSWVQPFAKGCLMARAGLDASAPYLAVCRPADEEPLRVQIRETAGGDTEAVEHDIVPPATVAPSSVAWIRLVVSQDGTCATGYGAWQRGRWVEIASRCLPTPLTHQGLAASSHDDGSRKLLFVDPRHDGTTISAGALTDVGVGTASGQAFDGPFP
jgi:Phosphoinositide phospholipase C, Ca2+-dependent